MTKLVSNAVTFAFIELSIFMTNYEFESRMNFNSLNTETNDRLSNKKRILTQKTTIIIKKMKDIWDFIKNKLANAQKMQKMHADKHKTLSSEYQLEDMIWLFTKNIKIERSFKKLNHKWIDLYKIKKIMINVCQLYLSQSMKIRYISYLTASFRSNRSLDWTNSIFAVSDYNRRRKERIWDKWHSKQSLSLWKVVI
jgi:hypothetical protein